MRGREAVPPPIPAEAGLRRALAAALQDSARAVARGDDAAALRALELALSVQPEYAPALVERARLRLRAEDLDEAEADLAAALHATGDPRALAAIHREFAAISERREDPGGAALALARARLLDPADGGAAEPATCVAADAAEAEAMVFSGWRALVQNLDALATGVAGAEAPAAIADEAGAEAAACAGGACAGAPPWFVVRGSAAALVEPAPVGRLRAYALGPPSLGGSSRCEGSIARAAGPHLGLSVRLACESQEAAFTCAEGQVSEDGCFSTRWDATRIREDLYFAAAPLRRVLKVERRAWAEGAGLAEVPEDGFAVAVTEDAGGVAVRGAGCDLRVALTASR